MSATKHFLRSLRRLMDEIPDGLTLEQLEWAVRETSLTLGVKIAAIHADDQHEVPIPRNKHAEGTGTH